MIRMTPAANFITSIWNRSTLNVILSTFKYEAPHKYNPTTTLKALKNNIAISILVFISLGV
jgi:hypothetical protein